ncbi:MAG: GtrA family protein [Rhodospirillaceae bacterium]
MRSWASLKEIIRKHEVKVRFVIVGGANTVFGLVSFPILYFLLHPLGMHYMFILIISQTLGILVSYTTNKLFVFRTKGNIIREFMTFSSFHLIIFALNLAALPTMVELLEMHPVISQVLFAGIIIVSSYFWYSKVTFKHKHKRNVVL